MFVFYFKYIFICISDLSDVLGCAKMSAVQIKEQVEENVFLVLLGLKLILECKTAMLYAPNISRCCEFPQGPTL